jgi:hypothetical protein
MKKEYAIAIAFALLLAWYFRFEITPLAPHTDSAGFYMVNRWTGDVTLVGGVTIRETKRVSPQ